MGADNSAHLLAAVRRRREATLQRAREALAQLAATGEPVTFRRVAEAAGVSRSWLYGEAEIRAEIERLRELGGRSTEASRVPVAQRASEGSLRTRLAAAHERNKALAQENQQLREQLAAAHGQLRATREASSSS